MEDEITRDACRLQLVHHSGIASDEKKLPISMRDVGQDMTYPIQMTTGRSWNLVSHSFFTVASTAVKLQLD
jgi:hypothetical protein